LTKIVKSFFREEGFVKVHYIMAPPSYLQRGPDRSGLQCRSISTWKTMFVSKDGKEMDMYRSQLKPTDDHYILIEVGDDGNEAFLGKVCRVLWYEFNGEKTVFSTNPV
jgi:hypothetical protein